MVPLPRFAEEDIRLKFELAGMRSRLGKHDLEMAVDVSRAYFIRAIWDPEADVYYSETDVPGLVVEAASLAEFVVIAEELLPDLLKANTQQDVVPGSHIVTGTFGIAV